MYSVIELLPLQVVTVEHLELISRVLVCDIVRVVVPQAPLKPKSTLRVVVVGKDIMDPQSLFARRVTKYLLFPIWETFISPPAAYAALEIWIVLMRTNRSKMKRLFMLV